LFTGQIQFYPVPPASHTFWALNVQSVSVGGTTIPVPASLSVAAIDTGESVIGVPSSIATSIYKQIPGSSRLSDGTFIYPCKTPVNLALSFKSQTSSSSVSWPISSDDFNAGTQDGTNCYGAVFDVGAEGDEGAWVIGDAFLKNVYSVFEYQKGKPMVGFAKLSESAGAATVTSRPPELITKPN